MKKILLLICIILTNYLYAQVYTIRAIGISNNVRDSLYLKNSSSDTVWRNTNNVWSVAYIAKQWAYFPFFQAITPPSTLSGYGITDAIPSQRVLDSLVAIRTALNGKQAAGTYATGTGTASGTNTGDQTNISGNAATVTTNANLTGIVTSVGNATTIGAGSVTNTMLSGSIDLATKVTGVLPFANGGMGSSAATSATTGTISVAMSTQIITCVPSGALTLNGTGGVTGERTTFVFTTSGVSSFVVTFGTNFKSAGTLSTGTTSGKVFTVSFIYNGTSYLETGRTIAM